MIHVLECGRDDIFQDDIGTIVAIEIIDIEAHVDDS